MVGPLAQLHFVAKITGKKRLKIWIFSCLLCSQFFIQIFVQKTADFTILFAKEITNKKSANEKKWSVWCAEQFFFPLGLKNKIFLFALWRL